MLTTRFAGNDTSSTIIPSKHIIVNFPIAPARLCVKIFLNVIWRDTILKILQMNPPLPETAPQKQTQRRQTPLQTKHRQTMENITWDPVPERISRISKTVLPT